MLKQFNFIFRPSRAPRTVFLHYHIFKNAGVTIDWILAKNFARRAICMDTDVARAILPTEVAINYLEANPRISAFSSHQLRLPVPQIDSVNFIPMYFIRHPIDRACSVYSFNRSRPDGVNPDSAAAKEMSISDYIKYLLEKDNKIITNFQIAHLSGKDLRQSMQEEDLHGAIERMRSCTILGVVDRLDESLVAAEENLKATVENLDLAYVRQNVTRSGSLHERIEIAISEMENNVFSMLGKQNLLDMELYQEANRELDRRLNEIDDLESKLTNFRLRCEKLSKDNIRKRLNIRTIIYNQHVNKPGE